MQLALPSRTEPRAAPTGTVNLIWWGRLQESVKQARSLILITAALRERGVDAELTVIGPDSGDLTAAQLADDAAANGVADAVHLLGALHGQALIDATSAAHVYLLTSVIEGSSLALVEAQALGLPVAMYELPWLANLEGNEGVLAARQHDVRGLARQIDGLVSDPGQYAASSAASLVAARKAVDFDFPELYKRLLARDLGDEYSPEPTLAHARLILEWTTFYSEANSARHTLVRQELKASKTQIASLQKQVAKLREATAGSGKRAGSVRKQLGRAKRKLMSRLRRHP